MSLFGALSASLTALTAQSRAVNVISNNISNLSTTGFKSTSVSFSTLIAGTVGGGVIDSLRQDISTQGAVNSTGVGTDLAIQGSGFFVVADSSGNVRYTRAGSFRTDSQGRLVNEAGYVLKGWPLDANGLLPGEAGNTTNTTSFADLTSLDDININDISGTASPTSAITAKINLKAEEDILQGAGDTLEPVSSYNSTNSSTDILLPSFTGAVADFAVGSTLTITNGEGTATYTYGGIEASLDVTTLAGVTSASSDLGLTDDDAFSIQSDSMTAAITFTYNSDPDAEANEFSTLDELADLIDATDGLRGRVLTNGAGDVYLYVAPDDANEGLDFVNVTGTLLTTLGLADTTASGDGRRFASLGDLNTLIQDNLDSDGIDSILNTPSSNSTLELFNVDPTTTITFGGSDTDLLDELGLTTTAINAVYEALGASGDNMASGTISPDFSRTITVYDSLGNGLDLRLAFTKIQSSDTEAVWAVELYAPQVDGQEVVDGGLDGGGLLSYGTVSFNGDGTLKSVDGPIASDIDIDPNGEATTQSITVDFGTAGDVGVGLADGLSQFAGSYRVQALTQNGFPTGTLQSLQIDSEGFVTAVFDNSLTSQVYKLPVAYFSNPNGLDAESGNAYSETTDSGDRNLGQVGEAGVGTIVPGALEVSTAEIGSELTKLIVSQQSYSASANVLRKVGELFDELKQL